MTNHSPRLHDDYRPYGVLEHSKPPIQPLWKDALAAFFIGLFLAAVIFFME